LINNSTFMTTTTTTTTTKERERYNTWEKAFLLLPDSRRGGLWIRWKEQIIWRGFWFKSFSHDEIVWFGVCDIVMIKERKNRSKR
jgi:hypothetical protein